MLQDPLRDGKPTQLVTPTDTEIRAELNRIQLSQPFVRSQRIRRLLDFLVESVLTGNGSQIKESLIGVEVFDRPADYDTKQDPVVRVEMRRLRSKLSEYYLQEGKADEVLIWLDKGTYVPNLTYRDLPAAERPKFAQESASTPIPDMPGTVGISPQRKRRNWTILGILIGAGLLATVATGIFLIRSPGPKAPLRVVPLTGNAGLETSPAFSPDSKQVAYSWNGNRRNFDIYVKSLGGGGPRRLTDNSAHDVDPAWSPDGRQIAFLRAMPETTQLVIIPSTGGVEKPIADLGKAPIIWHPDEPEQNGAGGPAWSSDGTYLLVSVALGDGTSASIVKVSIDGRKTVLTTPGFRINDFSPRVSPAGSVVAFTRNWGSGSFDLFTMPSTGGTPTRLTFDSREIQGAAWLDEDRILYSSNRLGSFRLWQISRSDLTSQPFYVGGAQPQWPALSRDGHWLAFVEPINTASIWRLQLRRGRPVGVPESFISSARKDYSPNYSPNGRSIAFVSDRSGTSQIWTADRDGLGARQLTNFSGSSVGSPHWSPDGRKLVFDGGLTSESSLWVVDADGGNLHRVNGQTKNEYMPSWSNDGKWVYFYSSKDDRLMRENPITGNTVMVANGPFIDATESADGQTIYMQRIKGGIWKVSVAGGTPVPVAELQGILPTRYWTVRGDTFYFVRRANSHYEIESFQIATKQFEKLGTIPVQLMVGTQGIAVSPEADALLFVQKEQRRSNIMLQER